MLSRSKMKTVIYYVVCVLIRKTILALSTLALYTYKKE